jgi:hypothetical protein
MQSVRAAAAAQAAAWAARVLQPRAAMSEFLSEVLSTTHPSFGQNENVPRAHA